MLYWRDLESRIVAWREGEGHCGRMRDSHQNQAGHLLEEMGQKILHLNRWIVGSMGHFRVILCLKIFQRKKGVCRRS